MTGEQKSCGNVDRRALLLGGTAAVAGLSALPLARSWWQPRASVFIARGQEYSGPLVTTLRDGLESIGVRGETLRGKRIILKPNLVEPRPEAPHMTTHPSLVAAAAELFRSWGAEVTVGEAPGHLRDTQMALFESGLHEVLQSENLAFADLNYEDVVWVENRLRVSNLSGLHLPATIAHADLIVSMPKMKTHHWVGVTAAMKNLYGTLPGIIYGWPKNVLHHQGIPQTVVDINAALPPTLAIVDGIECMEGDGPIMGTPKRMGLILMGTNLPAVDATVARIMVLCARSTLSLKDELEFSS